MPCLLPLVPLLPGGSILLLGDEPLLFLLLLAPAVGLLLQLLLLLSQFPGSLLLLLLLVLGLLLLLLVVGVDLHVLVELVGGLVEVLLAGELLLDQLVPLLLELPQLGLAFLLQLAGGIDEEVDPGPDGLLFSEEFLPLALLGREVGLAFELVPFEFLLEDLEILLANVGLSDFDCVLEFVFFPIEFLGLQLVVGILVVDFLPVVFVGLVPFLFVGVPLFVQLITGLG